MNVGEMQRLLSLKAEKEPNHKFGDLYSLLENKDWLRLAHDHVKQNQGSITAGCDGINMKGYDENLEENQQKLIEELKNGQFRPYPVRRVHIPKANGKLRPLGIPSIKDRIVQEALRMILEPIYEASFSQYSFGFRPNRCTMDAIKCITWSTLENKKYFWVIEGDIASYFDTINHRRMMQIVRQRIKDKKILELIWEFLRAGVMEKKLFRDTKQGTPQGGIISPLLANIYLHELDRYMKRHTEEVPKRVKEQRRRQGLGNYAYVRYADDFVILCNGTKELAEEMRKELYSFLKKDLKLELSLEKTRITHLNDGFKFLGFWIQRAMGHNGMKTKVTIPREAMDRVKGKIAKATDPTTHQDSLNSTILALNRVTGGWMRYYQYTSKAATTFGKVEYYAFWKLAHWIGRKYQLAMPQVLRQFRRRKGLGTNEYQIKKVLPTSQYKKRFIKPNPYTTQGARVQREELPTETYWTGYEPRPSMMDLKPIILQRDEYTCRNCGKERLPTKELEVDHIRPVRRFKRPVDANTPENLWALCKQCHRIKTKLDRQMESRMQ